jgi:malonyl-CoA decarboxylase
MLSGLFDRYGKAKSAAGLKTAQQLCLRLLSEAGAANSAAIASQLIRAYAELEPEPRLAFFEFLDSALAVDRERLIGAAQAYTTDSSAEHLFELQRAAEPLRQELLRRINRAPGGVAAIVAMRRDLLKLLRAHPRLKGVDTDFAHLLASWFNPGFLNLQRVDWNAPAALLEKIVRHEAVHEIRGWSDLRRRLQPDRRLYAFVHPQLPGEPLIFVEIALLNAIPSSIREVIRDDPEARPQRFNVAVFYSISNCEPGLKGVSLGNFLIKRVAEQLHAEIPTVKRFCTLSPIPGFRTWLAKLDVAELPQEWPVPLRSRTTAALEALRKRYGRDLEELANAVRARTLSEDDAARLGRCVAIFLTQETRTPRGDPVARFHLDNGARLERVNPGADLSAKGLRESFGVMVNYLYDLSAVEANHERFVHGEVVASRQVAALT